MWLALGVTLGQLGVAGGQQGLVSANKGRKESPVLLSCPTQPQIMPQQMQLSKAIQTWRPASLGSAHPGQLTKRFT